MRTREYEVCITNDWNFQMSTASQILYMTLKTNSHDHIDPEALFSAVCQKAFDHMFSEHQAQLVFQQKDQRQSQLFLECLAEICKYQDFVQSQQECQSVSMKQLFHEINEPAPQLEFMTEIYHNPKCADALLRESSALEFTVPGPTKNMTPQFLTSQDQLLSTQEEFHSAWQNQRVIDRDSEESIVPLSSFSR